MVVETYFYKAKHCEDTQQTECSDWGSKTKKKEVVPYAVGEDGNECTRMRFFETKRGNDKTLNPVVGDICTVKNLEHTQNK